jgi:hypothetical protein
LIMRLRGAIGSLRLLWALKGRCADSLRDGVRY